MKRNIILSALIIISILPGNAQLLWKISDNGLKQDSYLFGTHHLIPIQFLDSVPGIYPAFNKSNMVVSEIVFNDFDVTAKIQQAAMLPDTLTMEDLLTPDEFNVVDKELMSTMQMSLMNVNKMHPFLIKTLYELELYKERTHFDMNSKSDSYFQLVANQKNIPVKGLETVDKQIELLFPQKDLKGKAQQLVQAIKNKNTLYKEYQEVNKLYRSGNIEGLDELNTKFNKEWGISTEENATIIDHRNADWVKQLPLLLKSNACFIAVGAMHLPGKNGLIQLLRNEGYKVVPVKAHKINML